MQYPADDLFTQQSRSAVADALADTLLELVFDGVKANFETWQQSPPEAARLIWEAQTERRKLSNVAESFFRRLARQMGGSLLLKKGELHRLIPHAVLSPTAEADVRSKLDLLQHLFERARQRSEVEIDVGDNGQPE